MSVSDSSRSRFGDHPPRRSAAISSSRAALGAGQGEVGFEILGEPFIQPQGEVAECPVEQRVGPFVSQVFLEARVGVGVDDPILALRQEERPARWQLGMIEFQEMVERVAVFQHVDLDRILGHRRPEAQVMLHVALQRLEAPDR